MAPDPELPALYTKSRMPHALFIVAEVITTVLTLAGMGYFVAALWAAAGFLRTRNLDRRNFAPAVSILKSLKGCDPGMLEAFRTHCRQDYAGNYELLFGVADAADPAMAAVEQLQREFPQLPIRLLHCPEQLGSNKKISTLMQMERTARYDYLLINDSDIAVTPHYLTDVMRRFSTEEGAPEVGMVTALYRGRAHRTLGSYFESMGIATDFQPGVLLSIKVEGGLHYGLGSTLAVSRKALHAAGGLKALADELADDHVMGKRIDQAGFRVVLAGEVVETSVPAYRWRAFTDHQLRWLRTVRDARPGGYFGMIFTHGFGWAVINALVCAGSTLSLALLAASLLLRHAMATVIAGRVLDDQQSISALWLLPARDLTQMALWIAGFCGNTIVWRGERFTLKNGKLVARG